MIPFYLNLGIFQRDISEYSRNTCKFLSAQMVGDAGTDENLFRWVLIHVLYFCVFVSRFDIQCLPLLFAKVFDKQVAKIGFTRISRDVKPIATRYG